MTFKTKKKRHTRKEIRKQFETAFDIAKLDYEERVRPLGPKALLRGVATAALLYGLAWGAMYYGWSINVLPEQGFASLVWTMMLPSTVAGILVWQIGKNRMEYPIRREIAEYIGQLEKDGGLLWRFGPLLEQFDDAYLDNKKSLVQSQQNAGDKIAIEDYVGTVKKLDAILNDGSKKPSQDALAEIECNLDFKSI